MRRVSPKNVGPPTHNASVDSSRYVRARSRWTASRRAARTSEQRESLLARSRAPEQTLGNDGFL